MNHAPTEGPLSHHPNLKEPAPDALFCFLDKDRQCSAECMAFETFPPEGSDYKDKQWSHCLLLVNAHRGGKHLVVLAQVASDIKKKGQDQARLSGGSVPNPRGG